MRCWGVSSRVVAAAVLIAACGSPPGGIDDSTPDASVSYDASGPDAPPPDAQLPPLGPSLVLDDFHIASISEDPHPFSLLGMAINPQLEAAVADGQLLLGLELRDLDDPTGQSDDSITVGMYLLQDLDADPTDNFDPDAPEGFVPQAGMLIAGEPTIHFTEASITDGFLEAAGVGVLDLLGGLFPVPLHDPRIEGTLVGGTDDDVGGDVIMELVDGRLRTALPASVLAIVPNIAGGMCPGETLLDVLVGGCGFPISLQPDVDIDGDGLEKIQDTDDDGAIDQCIDGDGTVINGAMCATDPAIADGYRVIFAIHGVRAIILDPS